MTATTKRAATAALDLPPEVDPHELDPYGARERVFAARFGWRPSRAQRCPRVAAGLRCVAYNGGRRDCICLRHSDLLDHAAVWLDRDGNHVYTAEPYGARDDELAAFLADANALGLTVTVHAESGWYLGRTILLRVKRGKRDGP
jgi:hypothetical protein